MKKRKRVRAYQKKQRVKRKLQNTIRILTSLIRYQIQHSKRKRRLKIEKKSEEKMQRLLVNRVQIISNIKDPEVEEAEVAVEEEEAAMVVKEAIVDIAAVVAEAATAVMVDKVATVGQEEDTTKVVMAMDKNRDMKIKNLMVEVGKVIIILKIIIEAEAEEIEMDTKRGNIRVMRTLIRMMKDSKCTEVKEEEEEEAEEGVTTKKRTKRNSEDLYTVIIMRMK